MKPAALLLVGLILLPVVSIAGLATWTAGGWGGALDPNAGAGGMTYAQWVHFDPVVDRRPFLLRLRDSLTWSFSGRVNRDPVTGAVRGEITKFEFKGGAEW